jgi:hypothetical protein
MGENRVLYDALAMPVVDPGMVGIGLFVFMGFSAVAVASWRKPSRGLTQNDLMRRAISALVATAMLVFLTYAGVQTIIWRYNYTHHHFAVLDGCVTDFEEAAQSDHDLGVDDFMLQGHPFRLSDSGWRVGYHRSHHHGSPLQDGVHLRAFANGGSLLRIEQIRSACMGDGSDQRVSSR